MYRNPTDIESLVGKCLVSLKDAAVISFGKSFSGPYILCLFLFFFLGKEWGTLIKYF